VWVHEPPKVSFTLYHGTYFEADFKALISSKELSVPPANPLSSTWGDRIAIAFIAFLFMLLLIMIVFAVIYLVGALDISYIMPKA
jgi:hypothetical protein